MNNVEFDRLHVVSFSASFDGCAVSNVVFGGCRFIHINQKARKFFITRKALSLIENQNYFLSVARWLIPISELNPVHQNEAIYFSRHYSEITGTLAQLIRVTVP